MWTAVQNCGTGKKKFILSAGQNFFAQVLFPDLTYYIFPPPGVIVAASLHLSHFKTHGVNVPMWPASSFWLSIVRDGCHLAVWAVKWMQFRPGMVSDINIREREIAGGARSGTRVQCYVSRMFVW